MLMADTCTSKSVSVLMLLFINYNLFQKPLFYSKHNEYQYD